MTHITKRLVKVCIITRSNLTDADQAVQACHVAMQFMMDYPESARSWHAQSNTLVLLTVENEQGLQRIIDRAFDLNVRTAAFREPDLNNALTAIALEPSDKNQRICKNLPLALGG